MKDLIWPVTDLALRGIESVIRSRIHVSGTLHLGDGPSLLVANHFTRFETFLIPYVHYKATRRIVRCLADGNLFVGSFGRYLRRMDAWPTDDPGYKQQIVKDLATGSCDWVIYPEGAMIKNKAITRNGRLYLDNPFHQGPPRTGAAVFALKAETLRWQGLQALANGDTRTAAWVCESLGLDNIDELDSLAKRPVSILPVTITYYPLRPGSNLVDQAAELFLGELPPNIQEELQVEGNLLFGGADIDIHFGTPQPLAEVVQGAWRRSALIHPWRGRPKQLDAVLASRRQKVITAAMRKVYGQTAVNIDHLVAMALRRFRGDRLPIGRLRQALYSTAVTCQHQLDLRTHPQLVPACEELIGTGNHAAFADILSVAERTGVCRLTDDHLLIDPEQDPSTNDFHSLRLYNPLAVIANELEASPRTSALITELINLPDQELARRTATALALQDRAEFAAEWRRCHGDLDELPAWPDSALPRLLSPRRASGLGVVLMHGYLSRPAEVTQLATYLQQQGHSVLLPRLPGHGSAPERLREVTWQDWWRAYRRAMLQLHLRGERVIAAGFSAGGLLALQAAALHPDICHGVLTINSPLRLRDRRAHLAPLVKAWNAGLESIGATRQLTWINNQSESPDINYDRHPPASILELVRLMQATEDMLERVQVPTAVLQANRDPVTDPVSAELIHAGVRADERSLVWFERDRHGMVRGEDSAAIFHEVSTWLNTLDQSTQGQST